MNTQTIALLGALGELVSAIAVVVSLIYVGIQVKQNTRAIRSNTLQNISENQLNIYALLAANGDLAEIGYKAATGTGSDKGVEHFRFTAWMHTAFRSLENAYYQHQDGALDERNWQGLCRQYGPLLQAGLNRKYWEERKFIYSDEFKAFVDKELLAKPMHEGWKVPGS